MLTKVHDALRAIRGFTILEIMIVVAIIGIILTIGITSYNGYQTRTRDTTREANAKIITSALEQYHNQHGSYPNVGTMIGSTAEKATALAKTLNIDPKILLTPSAPSNVVNSIVNFATNPDSTMADVFRYEGLDDDGDPSYADCKSETITDYISTIRLAVEGYEKPLCYSFKFSYKQESSNSWKYITSIY